MKMRAFLPKQRRSPRRTQCPIDSSAGINIFGIFARWDDQTFRFTTNINNYGADMDGEYASLQGALDALRVTVPVAPSWEPDGFMHERTAVTRMDGRTFIDTEYANGEASYLIRITLYDDMKAIDSRVFEKDKEELWAYEVGGNAHYIMENLGQIQVTWIVENMVCNLTGDLQRADVIKMIDSIYGG